MKTAKKTRRYNTRFFMLGIALLIGLTTVYMMHPIFGKRPTGERLARLQNSSNYHDGKFKNLNITPQLSQNLGVAIYEYIFKKSNVTTPKTAIPAKYVNWDSLSKDRASLIWLGHSTYLIKMDGKTILVDPVLSQNASPIPRNGKPFKGTSVTTASELPWIDFLFITHDHYDHMDYETLKILQPKVGKVITGLGVGAHLEYWGFKTQQMIETDWWDDTDLGDGITVTTTPARHFSGRSIWSANTLWASYVLRSPSHKIYLGGDSGYDTHFAEIGDQYGPFDLAILENGQYDKSWKYIHMQPEEVIQAFKDLRAKVLLPVHSAKFTLANHAWYEPLERISQLSINELIPVITPMIGEVIDLDQQYTKPTFWWKNIK